MGGITTLSFFLEEIKAFFRRGSNSVKYDRFPFLRCHTIEYEILTVYNDNVVTY